MKNVISKLKEFPIILLLICLYNLIYIVWGYLTAVLNSSEGISIKIFTLLLGCGIGIFMGVGPLILYLKRADFRIVSRENIFFGSFARFNAFGGAMLAYMCAGGVTLTFNFEKMKALFL